jgi:hypothetical protein
MTANDNLQRILEAHTKGMTDIERKGREMADRLAVANVKQVEAMTYRNLGLQVPIDLVPLEPIDKPAEVVAEGIS